MIRKKARLRRGRALVYGAGSLVIGVALVISIHAATPSASFEAESGVLAQGAKTVSSAAASSGAAVQFGSAGSGPGNGVFTIASLPDTQRDLHDTAGVARFNGRLSWLLDHRASLNLQYILQVGDLQDWDTPDHAQYKFASDGLKLLENAQMPFALSIGNHDTAAVCVGGSACPGASTPQEVRNTATWNMFYPPSRFPGLVTFEAGKTDNAYRVVSFGGLSWLIINYELWPRTQVVDWMKTVVASHPHDNVILLTHSYLEATSVISAYNGGYGANSPKYVYDNLISKYPNIRFNFSGHTGNAGYREDTGVNGNKIYSFLDTYHDTTNNWIRLLTFDTVKNTITTKVYAPVTNATRPEAVANVTISGVNWVR